MKYILPANLALLGFLDVFDKSQEVCGSYQIKGKSLISANCFNGTMEDGRYYCQRNIDTITPVTYHTHICESPGYPSYEDLVTLIEEDKYIDIIYTCWGIWVVKLIGTIEPNKKYIEEILHRDVSPFNNGIDKLKLPTKRVMNAINTFISLMRKNNYSIKFYTWGELGNVYITLPDNIAHRLKKN